MNMKDVKDAITVMSENDVAEIFEAVLSNPHVLSGAIATESDVYRQSVQWDLLEKCIRMVDCF